MSVKAPGRLCNKVVDWIDIKLAVGFVGAPLEVLNIPARPTSCLIRTSRELPLPRSFEPPVDWIDKLNRLETKAPIIAHSKAIEGRNGCGSIQGSSAPLQLLQCHELWPLNPSSSVRSSKFRIKSRLLPLALALCARLSRRPTTLPEPVSASPMPSAGGG